MSVEPDICFNPLQVGYAPISSQVYSNSRTGFNPLQVGYAQGAQYRELRKDDGFNPLQVGYARKLQSAISFGSYIVSIPYRQATHRSFAQSRHRSERGFNPLQVGYAQSKNQVASVRTESFNPLQVGYAQSVDEKSSGVIDMFQSLIGRLRTERDDCLAGNLFHVSIPYRQATHRAKDIFRHFSHWVSIPYRQATHPLFPS